MGKHALLAILVSDLCRCGGEMTLTEWQKITNRNWKKFCDQNKIKYSYFPAILKRGYSFIMPKGKTKHELSP